MLPKEERCFSAQYVKSFVEKWDELIGWEGRSKGEGEFFIRQLKGYGAERVLDLATGTGFHSVSLSKAGFEVTSVDGSTNMLSKAFENGRAQDLILKTVHADWRNLADKVHSRFDAAVCLGNSFTHLFKERDRRRALAEFYSMLKSDGILILDHRNYDRMLDEGFSTKHKYYYCGDGVDASPEEINDEIARFLYRFPDGSEYHLNMFPLRVEYVNNLLHEVGFQRITTYGDFKDDGSDNPDFFIHIAEKKFDEEELPV